MNRIVLILIISSFIFLFLLILITGLISSPFPVCTSGRVSNLITLTSRTGENLSYTPGIEACHSEERCSNPLTPCVFNPGTGTSCPNDVNYDGLLLPSNFVSCQNETKCPLWSTVGFNEYNGFFLQTQEKPTLCGVPENQEDRLWPLNCILGQLTFNIDDERYYCSNSTLSCSSGEILSTTYDLTENVQEFFCR